jgi:hypothetical protein
MEAGGAGDGGVLFSGVWVSVAAGLSGIVIAQPMSISSGSVRCRPSGCAVVLDAS